ncbi:MAG TPA: hypothetical protein VN158_16975, partial [Caulobacter sp.]|nr:hypothetical protein [Caulobacter sp.]
MLVGVALAQQRRLAVGHGVPFDAEPSRATASLARGFRPRFEPNDTVTRYLGMDRLEHLLESLKAFALTRPIAYGAPACAAIGVIAGLAMQTGPQEGYTPEMSPASTSAEATVEPIAWPAGKVPDYVVGTDFLPGRQPEQPPEVVASYEVPEYVPAAWSEPEPEIQAEAQYVRPAEPADRTWPSTAGDIL